MTVIATPVLGTETNSPARGAVYRILGGGVVGLCVASELVSRGCEVVLSDPAGPPGEHGCSWWAGGMLAPDCEGATAEEPVIRLGRKAASWWDAQGVPVSRKGTVVVALDRDRRELQQFARRTENHRWLDRAALAELEPDLAERFDHALLMEDEAHLEPRAALMALSRQLETQGVAFQPEDTRPGEIIDCRGLTARDCLPDLRGVKGEMLVLRSADLSLERPVRLLHPRFPLYIVPRGDGVFMLGATQIECGERDRASVRSVMELLSAAYALHPAFGEAAILEIGADARPAFPDNLPRIGRAGGRVYVNGLFRHGFLLAPSMAVMAADYLIDRKRPELWHEDHS